MNFKNILEKTLYILAFLLTVIMFAIAIIGFTTDEKNPDGTYKSISQIIAE